MTICLRALLVGAVSLNWVGAAAAQNIEERPPVVPSCLSGQECPDGSVPVEWVDLGGFAGTAAVNAINAAGDRVGVAHTRFDEERFAVLWTRTGSIRTIAPGIASDINNRGQVTGYTGFADGAHAFVWTEETGFRDLGTLGGAFSYGHAINDRGWVAGSSEIADSSTHAFLWTPEDGMIDLGTLGGPHSTAYGLNLWGQVVGTSMTADRESHAFTWTRETGMVDLGLGTARDVNRNGWIVGQQYQPGTARAVAWTPSGILTLGLGNAIAINELGDIAWNAWTATLWSWSLGVINMQLGTAEDINELRVLVGTEVLPDDDYGVSTGAFWRVETGWEAEFSAVRRLADVVASGSHHQLPNGAVNALARAEAALMDHRPDAAAVDLLKAIRHVERLTRSGAAPEWYVLLGTLKNILGRIGE